MSKKLGICVAVLSVIAICLSAFSLFAVKTATDNQPKEEAKDVQYVMYVGTNDKDTNEPVCKPEEAKAKVDEILIKHFGGFTIQDANGGWVDDSGKRYDEYTVVVYISDTDLESVHKAADDLIKEFNQSSVLIQANETKTEFYSTEQQ